MCPLVCKIRESVWSEESDETIIANSFRCLGAYTSYMSAEAAEHFFDDCQYENSNIEAAKE